MDWQPIETAPKDTLNSDYGRQITLSNGLIKEAGFWCCGVEIWTGESEYWIPQGWYNLDFESLEFKPTQWREL